MTASTAEQLRVGRFEIWFEVGFWVSAVGCALLALLPGVPGHTHHVLVLGVITGLFTLVYYHLLPETWTGLTKTFYGSLVAVALITALLWVTGSVHSPFAYGSLYIMPIAAGFLVLDARRAWLIYGAAMAGWTSVVWHSYLGHTEPLRELLVPSMIKLFAMTVGTMFIALLAGELRQEARRERQVTQQLRAAQAETQAMIERLHQVNRDLQRLARVKDDFVAMINHELRTPLTAMRQGVALLLDGTLGTITEEQREYLDVVHRNTAQLHELISNLLDLSKLQAGKLQVRLRPTAVAPVIQEAVKTMQPLLEQRTVRQELAELPPALADEQRLLQVVNNVLNNAIKYTPADGLIAIRGYVQGRQLVISVTDNGKGMSAQQLGRLFHRFERQDTEESRPGTGLGLVICRELMELQQGRIEVTSTIGQGTTVSLWLSLAPAPAAVTAGGARA